jgi:hypothetical protein
MHEASRSLARDAGDRARTYAALYNLAVVARRRGVESGLAQDA